MIDRYLAIQKILEHVGVDDLVVSTTGMISREIFMADDRPGNFYMLGSMGLLSSFGLGLALLTPARKIPVLLIVGWRGYGGPPNDAPEHWIMGEKTPEFFDLLKVPYEVLESDNLESTLDRLLGAIQEQSVPGALLVRAGVIE